MGKVTIYLPDELADAVRRTGISMSPVCQRALDEEVARADLEFRRVIPTLGVRDMNKAIAYFTNTLGFTLASRTDNEFASIYRGRPELSANLYLRRVRTVHPSECYVWVSDPDALFVTYERSGATIVHPPQDKSWGYREFRITDPHGHVFTFFRHLEGEEP
jgi:uncharacterized glyoxalase superfamily protein PhnB